MKRVIIIGLFVFLTGGIAAGFYLFNKPHQSIAKAIPAFSIDAKTLVGEFDSNEKQANTKYLGKVVEVHGMIAEKLKDKDGNYNLTLQGPDLAGVGCEFDPAMQEKLANLKQGQEVKIKGICTGVLMDVVLVDCVCVSDNVQ